MKQIRKYITKLYSILPFETEFYARHNYVVDYVGNPTVKEIAEARAAFDDNLTFRQSIGLDPQRRIIAVVPGSRRKEIRDNLPTMLRAAKQYPDCQVVIAGAPSIDASLYARVMASAGITEQAPVVFGKSFRLVAAASVALVTSGTATLETAVLGTPQVVCYRMNGSPLVYNLYKRLLKVKYVSLPNLIADRPVIPELLLHYCNEQSVSRWLGVLLEDTPERRAMLAGYDEMSRRLGNNDCTATAAANLIETLKK